ncbi:hypothetical protein [Streptomyces sp. Rer75]|uniref:hypothetical protein n=1 Tax=unclassified Streptomyces TaxID=2593676 RepID=UPI00211F3ED3|nr:hypothetical protein [Streptomyces sp. Rer75]
MSPRQERHCLNADDAHAQSAGIQWTVPLPVLARYLNSVLDGTALCWLVDRNSESSLDVLRLVGQHLETLTEKAE